jgi:hypothetical protein
MSSICLVIIIVSSELGKLLSRALAVTIVTSHAATIFEVLGQRQQKAIEVVMSLS